MSEQSLNLLEHWMKTVVVERGGLREKLEAAAKLHGLCAEDVVAETRGLSAHERLAVYTGGYVLRLLECMRADFPVLRGFVGDSVFDAFAKAYVITMPPSSHSLYDLGAEFSKFLEETKPNSGTLELSRPRRRDFALAVRFFKGVRAAHLKLLRRAGCGAREWNRSGPSAGRTRDLAARRVRPRFPQTRLNAVLLPHAEVLHEPPTAEIPEPPSARNVKAPWFQTAE